VFFKAFLYLQYSFVICWQKNIGGKVARKILAKLMTGITLQVSNSFNYKAKKTFRHKSVESSKLAV